MHIPCSTPGTASAMRLRGDDPLAWMETKSLIFLALCSIVVPVGVALVVRRQA